MKLKLLCSALLFLIACTQAVGQVPASPSGPDHDALVRFLLKAKKATYASQGDGASVKNPVLPGTHQLEFTEGPFFYRDVYTGEAMFAGQEIVYWEGKPVWTMSYAGNIPRDVAKADVDAVVKLLHKALVAVPAEIPYRGPAQLQDGAYRYVNNTLGSFDVFFGRETIARDDNVLYELRYGGGLIR